MVPETYQPCSMSASTGLTVGMVGYSKALLLLSQFLYKVSLSILLNAVFFLILPYPLHVCVVYICVCICACVYFICVRVFECVYMCLYMHK